MKPNQILLATFPMHGQRKLSTEGYRTRDGHLIEWFGKILAGAGSVDVVSRPEPAILKRAYPGARVAPNTHPLDSYPWQLPNPFNPKEWWVESAQSYPLQRLPSPDAAVSWNPFVFTTPGFDKYASGVPFAFDLLDDWTVHHAFAKISTQVDRAYKTAFARADRVYANSEGTLALAERYSRSDALMMPNGTDRERFDPNSLATGPLTVGYIGKIGNRLDLDLIRETARAFPSWQFVFAGPIIDRSYRRPLKAIRNLELRGDVPYPAVPGLLQSFDIGWVPHSVGAGEVGGDAIKIYEYNAAGLPVLSTPIIGAGNRGIDDVHVLPASKHVSFLSDYVGDRQRIPRVSPSLPPETSWERKARVILKDLGIV